MIEEDVKGLLNSSATGEALYKDFVDQRQIETVKDRVDFLKPIRNPKIKTGLGKPKKDTRVINIMKEEKQAFRRLFRFIVAYLMSDEMRTKIAIPLVITER